MSSWQGNGTWMAPVLVVGLAALVPLECRHSRSDRAPAPASSREESAAADQPSSGQPDRTLPAADQLPGANHRQTGPKAASGGTSPEAVGDRRRGPEPAVAAGTGQAPKGPGGDEQPLLLPDEDEPLPLPDEAEPPLTLDDEPLLLDDPGEESPAAKHPVADNSRCHHCHLNYMDEKLAVVHAKANIGCADCHGNCDAHIADESWASGGNGTPPAVMYPRAKINPFCLECHPKEKIDIGAHKRLFAGSSKKKCCTDCHGQHRLAERKCKWK